MTDDNSKLVDINDDQEAFEAHFFQTTSASDYHGNDEPEAEEEVEAPEDEEVTETDLETNEDTDAEAPEEEAEDEEQEEEEPEEAPKPKARKSARERIDELTAEKYELRRELEALRRDFESSKPRQEKVEEAKVEPEASAPDPFAEDENGDMIYPLGEFDPAYIRDVTKFTIKQETETLRKQQEQAAAQRQVEAAQQEIADKWTANLEEAEKDIPEIRDNIKHLTEVFSDVEPNYGEYLASVIMSSDVGPQLMNYLSENIGEAQKIVASGPAAATLAIGRLEARFIKSTEQVEQEQLPKKKVSVAKDPPEQRTRGSGGRFSVSPDTDDQDAFEDLFYERKRK